MDLNTDDNKQELIGIFPGLDHDPEFRITSEQTDRYNCIGWAMGFDKRWVSYADDPFVTTNARRIYIWWPEGVEASERPEALIAAFEKLGFERTDNRNYEEGYDKAVLYSKDNKWTHAARIVSDTTEHSKFGGSWDALHGRDRFAGSSYGSPYAYMRRLHSEKQHYIDSNPARLAGYTINETALQDKLNILRRKFGSLI